MSELKISRKEIVKGFNPIVEAANSPLSFIDFGLLYLEPNDEWSESTENYEAVFLLQKGSCRVAVRYADKKIEEFSMGPRNNMFTDKAHLLYLPPQVSCNIVTEDSALEGAFIKAPANHKGRACYVTPGMMNVKNVGKDNWQRSVCLATIPECGAKKLLVGETFNPPGNWSSFPPHKHDELIPGKEVPLEEVYHYRFNPPGGFALQRIYETGEKADIIDTAIVVEEGDTVLLPRGYHPLAAAPGYSLYYLWILAGEEPLFGHWSEDQNHLI